MKNEFVDGSILAPLFPRLHHLSLIHSRYSIGNYLVDMAHNWLDTFLSINQFLRVLHISCRSILRLSSMNKDFVLTELNKRLLLTRGSSTYDIQFSEFWPFYGLIIWL